MQRHTLTVSQCFLLSVGRRSFLIITSHEHAHALPQCVPPCLESKERGTGQCREQGPEKREESKEAPRSSGEECCRHPQTAQPVSTCGQWHTCSKYCSPALQYLHSGLQRAIVCLRCRVPHTLKFFPNVPANSQQNTVCLKMRYLIQHLPSNGQQD